MYKLGNFTIVLPNYNCDKNCPFCIAKNNKKFNGTNSEDFDKLSDNLRNLRAQGFIFNRIVLSGNGEPSLYGIDDLRRYAEIILENKDMFKGVRIHTSGNIFWDKEKFELFNELFQNVEFDILRVALDSKIDMQVLGYNRDYLQSELFKRAKNIKFDIALTHNLETQLCPQLIERLLEENPNIRLIRFKNLMVGENADSKQAEWVRRNRINKIEFMMFVKSFLEHYGAKSLKDLELLPSAPIVFENSGNYPKDVVYSNGTIMDYHEQPVSIFKLQEMANVFDNTRAVLYNVIDL